jgi:hypothetical protein
LSISGWASRAHEIARTAGYAEFRDFKKVLFAWAAERNDSAEAMWDYCFAIADRRDATQNLDRVGTARAAVD